MAGQTVVFCATEQWIKNKLTSEKQTLDTVTALTLPGNYHEKITHLGRSLFSFSNLTSLDLSRNALETLEGLDHLKYLETLNVYYNNIPDLREVFRLRHNTKLKDVDLRLNPVTKNEPDYRLFIVHMLIHLRTLDERGVTDGERKAALMHFDTDQAYDFDKTQSHKDSPSLSPTEIRHKSSTQSRLDLVQSIASKRSGLGVDTDELLQLMAQRGMVGGTVFVQDRGQTTEVKRKVATQETIKKPLTENTRVGNTMLRHMPVIMNKGLTEGEAYCTSRPMVAYTPHPSSSQENNTTADVVSSTNTQQTENGAELKVPEDIRYKDELITLLKAQVSMLSTKVAEMGEVEEREKDIEKALRHTHTEMALLHQNCQSLLNENISLKTAASLSQSADNRTPPNNNNTNNGCSPELKQVLTDIGVLKQQQELISNEIHKLVHRQSNLLSHSSQLQKLAVMLQESHKSLVSTNTHLLSEIEDIKRNHAMEISQLQVNYEQLRKTLQKMKM